MNGPDGLEQRTADAEERSQFEYDELDRTEKREQESLEDTLISTQTQRILTGAAMLVMLCVTFTFGGCATLERHPVLTAVGTAIIAGSIAAAAQHHHDDSQFDRRIAPNHGPQCRPPTDGC